ncbi:unnamed protein product [Caenorhabditis angaria]|uniref:Gamma-aminobutyric acid type B receptor subunit 2 n=1 Tax=Caenorhabditis angaria TaxID=860376 RepID=A0A9P1N324_9PELO|nr:unnamed protein product [Caenorhabditis angaria]
MLNQLIFASIFWSGSFANYHHNDEVSCQRHRGGEPLAVGLLYVNQSNYPNPSPAFDKAWEDVRNRSCYLEKYSLAKLQKDTECKASLGMKALFDLIHSNPKPVAILGGQCTEVNEPLAMASKYFKIVQLSYAETHAKFSSSDSQELFPTFFRMVPGNRNTNQAKIKFLQHFNWKRVGTVKQNDHPRYALPHETLTNRLVNNGLSIVRTVGVNREQISSIGDELNELKNDDARIIIMDADAEMATTVLCAAYLRGMTGSNYVWILPGYHSSTWFNTNVTTNCTDSELEAALKHHFIFQFALARQDVETKIVGNTYAGFVWDEISANDAHNKFRGYVYDGVWALARALTHSFNEDKEFSHEKMLDNIINLDMQGVTGRVKFLNNERLGLVEILQWSGEEYISVGMFDGTNEKLEIKEVLNSTGWTRPQDSTIRADRHEYISSFLFLAMSLLAMIGITLALIFLLINFRYRNHRFIKMSSPNLNNIIIAGSIFTFVSVILLGIDTRLVDPENYVRICYLKTWTLCLGFTLAFGAMFSKTWRVHSIFTNIRMDRKAIKDSKLFMILGALLLIDIVVLFFWAILSPFSMNTVKLPDIHEDNTVITPKIETCASKNSAVFQAILYAVKGIVMILGCFLAWETRHVNVPALNDSKYIGTSVYCVVVMSVLGLSTSVILQDRVNEMFALASFFVIFSTTLTLCLVFVPKVIELARNPIGNEPRAYRRGLMKSVVAKTSQPMSPAASDMCSGDVLMKAENENTVRRRYLHQKSSQLWDLVEKLKAKGDHQFLQQG